jgi:peptidoglycan/LPS O-acetylase OafA/YrhL
MQMTITLRPAARPTAEAAAANHPVATPRPRSVGYLPGLDGLRALAVAAVVVYHANAAWLPGGFLGVEVFFVISGYLITLLLVEESLCEGRISLRSFWLRRARRLLPALLLTLAGVVVLTALFERQASGDVRGEVVAGLFYVSNWYQIVVGAGYTAAGDFAPLRHLWSLAVEEQFYLVWPLVMAALLWRRRARPGLIAVAFVVTSVAIAVAVALLVPASAGLDCTLDPEAFWVVGDRCISKIDTLYLSTFTRAGGLLLGAAMALLWRPRRVGRSQARDQGPLLDATAVLALLVLAAFTWSMHLITPDGIPGLLLFHGGFLLTGLASVAVIAAVVHPGGVVGWFLGQPVLRWAGTRSYGIYLYHWVVFQMIRGVAGRGLTPTEFAVGVAITLVITECSYRWLEMPVRTHGFRGTLQRWFDRVAPHRGIALAVLLMLAVLVGASTWVIATEPAVPNDIETSLDAGDAFVIDPFATTVPPTIAPTTAPPTTVPPSSTPPPGAAGAIGSATVVAGSEPLVVRSPLEPPTTTPETTPPETTLPPSPGTIPRYALGDSVMLGAAEQLTAAGFAVDAVQSRAFVNGLDRVQQLTAEGLLGDVVVVHLGTNGRIAGDQLAAMMQALAPVRRVIVLTVRADRSWVPGNNDRIRALVGQYPNVVVVDWEQLSRSCPGSCFYDDGIHLRPDGRRFYAEQVVAAL